MTSLPNCEFGIWLIVLLGLRAVIITETVRARALIAGIPVLLLILGAFFPSRAGGLIALAGWAAYGVGCLIILKRNAMGVR